MKKIISFTYCLPFLIGLLIITGCGDDSATGSNNTTPEVMIDTNITFTVYGNQWNSTDVLLNLSNSNTIQVEYSYSISQIVDFNELFFILIDTTCCYWNIDSIKSFSTTPVNKSYIFSPNNSNKKKLQLHLSYGNSNSDTSFIKLENFKVSKLN